MAIALATDPATSVSLRGSSSEQERALQDEAMPAAVLNYGADDATCAGVFTGTEIRFMEGTLTRVDAPSGVTILTCTGECVANPFIPCPPPIVIRGEFLCLSIDGDVTGVVQGTPSGQVMWKCNTKNTPAAPLNAP